MNNVADILLRSALAGSLALTICCGPRPVEANGPSAHLPRVGGTPSYSIDQVAGIAAPDFAKPIPISRDAPFVVIGWAVDGAASAAAGGVDVVIDGKAYAAEYGADRSDVADHYKIPAYAASGFTFSVPAAAFSKGTHRFAVRVLNSGKTGYWQGNTLVADLR